MLSPQDIGIRFPSWATQNRMIRHGVVKYAREHNLPWRLIEKFAVNYELPEVHIDEDWEGAGLIVFRCTETEAARWAEKRIPVVNLSSETNIATVPNVLFDSYQTGVIAANHLLELDFKHIAFVGNQSRNYAKQRFKGLADTVSVSKNGGEINFIDIRSMSLPPATRWKSIHEQLNLGLARLPQPCGILAADDIVALNVIRSANALGIAIPNTFALVSVNNSEPYCQHAFPQLTSIKYPAEEMGYRAAQIIHASQLSLEVPYQTVIPSPGLAERESTNSLAIKDPLINKITKNIRTKTRHGNVLIADLCSMHGVSNSKLRSRFKEVMGITVKEMIDKCRINHTKELLMDKSITVQEASFELGFSAPEELSRFFRRHTNLTPSQYMDRHRK